MISGNGEYHNHLGWLNKKRKPLQNTMILHKTVRWADKDNTENTIWKDWFFQPIINPPIVTTSKLNKKRKLNKRSFGRFGWKT